MRSQQVHLNYRWILVGIQHSTLAKKRGEGKQNWESNFIEIATYFTEHRTQKKDLSQL
jgi:hypothetical protein